MITPISGIRKAFYHEVEQLCAELKITGVSWPNTRFTAPFDTYVQPFIHYVNTSTVSLGESGYEQTTGFLQLTIVGRPDAGEKELDKVVESTLSRFHSGKRISVVGDIYLTITSSYRNSLIIEDGRPFVAVTSNFTIYTPKGV